MWLGSGNPDLALSYALFGHWNDGKGSNGPYDAAFRFPTVTIPQGATILTATVTVYQGSGVGTPTVRIVGDAVDNCAALSNTNFVGVSGSWVDTSSYVDWSVPNPGPNAAMTTPSLTTILQEVIDRAGWASGNALGVGLKDLPGNTVDNYSGCHTYDFGNASYYPTLTVTWSEGGGTSTAVFLHQRTEQGLS